MIMRLLRGNLIEHFYFSQFSKYSKMDRTKLLNLLLPNIPPLNGTHHKGQAGRVGVVGGSLEYTGAPYFSGIAALKVGADLVHIFCATPAAIVIKSYSPELIVHPLLDKVDAINSISSWFERLHVIIIGPGLGREPKILDVVSDLIQLIREKRIPLIIDADGLFLVTEKPDLIKNFTSPVILTPNKIEFERLSTKCNGIKGLKELNRNVTILRKGASDEFYCFDPELEWKVKDGGSGRRCGGQGDLLSGAIATFLHWTIASGEKMNNEISADNMLLASSLSCFAASSLIRACNEKAFQVKGRSMLASDMIEYIHEAFTELYGP